jgi:HAD superfamily hydrolase (TIGR01509 family)
MNIGAVAFDLDGTIIRTSVAFSPFRKRIGCIEGDVLNYINSRGKEEREVLYSILDEYELCIQNDCTLNNGFEELIDFLTINKIKTGIITRSTKRHAIAVADKLSIPISTIIGRDTTTPKPSGEPLQLFSSMLNVPLSRMLFVGDFMWDILAGKNAGVKTVFLVKDVVPEFASQADYIIHNLREVIDIIENKKFINLSSQPLKSHRYSSP